MPRGIDHLVIAVPDPDSAAAALEGALGISFPSGGRHPGTGTFNRIAFLGEPYLELIGIADSDAATHSPIGAAAIRALEHHPEGGFATFALLDVDLDATVSRLRDGGSRIAPPKRGSRTTPTGETVEWWTATFAILGPEEPPFLIRHASTSSEWSAEALDRRRAEVQPLGCHVALASLELAVSDPDVVAARYRSELRLDRASSEDGHAFVIGPQTVVLERRKAHEPAATIVMRCPGGRGRTVDAFGTRFELVAEATS